MRKCLVCQFVTQGDTYSMCHLCASTLPSFIGNLPEEIHDFLRLEADKTLGQENIGTLPAHSDDFDSSCSHCGNQCRFDVLNGRYCCEDCDVEYDEEFFA